MRKFMIGTIISLFATAAYASCVTNSYMSGGRVVVCTTCCVGGSCNTICN